MLGPSSAELEAAVTPLSEALGPLPDDVSALGVAPAAGVDSITLTGELVGRVPRMPSS